MQIPLANGVFFAYRNLQCPLHSSSGPRFHKTKARLFGRPSGQRFPGEPHESNPPPRNFQRHFPRQIRVSIDPPGKTTNAASIIMSHSIWHIRIGVRRSTSTLSHGPLQAGGLRRCGFSAVQISPMQFQDHVAALIHIHRAKADRGCRAYLRVRCWTGSNLFDDPSSADPADRSGRRLSRGSGNEANAVKIEAGTASREPWV